MPKPTWADIVSILPSLETGTALLEHYTKEVNWIYHILHIPTTTAQMKDNYDNLAADRPCDYGQIALLATVFATSAYFIHPSSSISQTTLRNMSRKDTLQCVHRWSHLAFHCLSQARYVANPTIETIQAVILLSHFLLMDDGATATYMALLMTMINAARILNIHKIDSKKSIKEREDALRRGEKVDFLELELKRRIWWHLASSDVRAFPILFLFLVWVEASRLGRTKRSRRKYINLLSETTQFYSLPLKPAHYGFNKAYTNYLVVGPCLFQWTPSKHIRYSAKPVQRLLPVEY